MTSQNKILNMLKKQFSQLFIELYDIDKNSFYLFGGTEQHCMIYTERRYGSQLFLSHKKHTLHEFQQIQVNDQQLYHFSPFDLFDGRDVGNARFRLQNFLIMDLARLNLKSIDETSLLQKIEEYSKVKPKFASLVNLVVNFHLVRQVYSAHVLVVLMNYSWT